MERTEQNDTMMDIMFSIVSSILSCRLQDKHYISHQVRFLLLIYKAGYFMQIDLTLIFHSFEYVD